MLLERRDNPLFNVALRTTKPLKPGENCTREKNLLKRRRTLGTCLRQWSRVNFCSADSSRVRQA